LADAIDLYHAVFDIDFVGDVVKLILAFAEIVGDAVDGLVVTWWILLICGSDHPRCSR
jgi:hypothetical protein